MPSLLDIRYKVLWIGKIAKHKGIEETKVLRNLKFLWLLGQFHESQVSRLQCRSVAQTDFVPVAAARGCGRVAGGCLRYGNWLVGVTMVCAAGRWLSGIALQIGCAGEHVLIRTNLVGTMCWLVVAGYAGRHLHRGAT